MARGLVNFVSRYAKTTAIVVTSKTLERSFVLKLFASACWRSSAHALYKISVGRRIFAILHNCESSVEGLSSIGGTFDEAQGLR